MTDLQSSLNPNNNLGTEQVTPVPTNDTGIDLSSTVEPNTVTPPAEVDSPVSSAPINSGVTLTATPNTSVSAVANQILQNNKQTQPVDSINNPVQAPTPEGIKGKKNGFMKGVLSGIVLTLLIMAGCILFAKDHVIEFLSSDNLDFLNLKANIIGLTDNTENNNVNTVNEEILPEEATLEEDATPEEEYTLEEENTPEGENTPEEEYTPEEEATPEEEYTPEEETTLEEATPEEEYTPEEEATLEEATPEEEYTPEEETTLEEATLEEATPEEEYTPEEATPEEEYTPEEATLEEATPEEEYTPEEATLEEATPQNYTLRLVNSPEEANWVISPNCDNALCDNDIESIVLCNEFRENSNLSDDSQRTGKSGICRYKDVSELAYIEFN